eukprot:CAMPEP_0172487862 /NCGR_PEP_ID=MMETSP1066-20121228/17124_1 /TAXON_ID=671091 /ORGANISM="Coscinodiscus wailesii, Strain CCMP2513" /LENGTH=441 /DNA_ID=CAMNT_0013254727 /DNA_START=205 /DNA_END=1530 /DNA_ORIENTATION=+
MGFDATQARNALNACDNNVERAAELLLTSSTPSSMPSPTPPSRHNHSHNPSVDNTNDDNLRRALEESRMTSQLTEDEMIQRAMEESLVATSNKKQVKSAASSRAGAAALARFAATEDKWGKKTTTATKNQKNKPKPAKKKTSPSHPPITTTATPTPTSYMQPKPPSRNLTIPTKMKDKTKEEQILRTVGRLTPHPRAVDTLLVALRSVRDHPENAKFRTINRDSPGFRSTLENVPGADDLFLAVNYQRRGELLVLDPGRVDVALLWMGISALEGARESEVYREKKRLLEFENAVRGVLASSSLSEVEERQRQGYLRKLSSEPVEGESGALLLHLHLTSDIIKRRRFDGDDQVVDVLHWIGSMGSLIPDKIRNGEWVLMDRNQSPPVKIPCDDEGLKKTLQWVGCWPSGRFELRPNVDEFSGEKEEGVAASNRGLGVTSAMV